jgi:hypothetical protein
MQTIKDHEQDITLTTINEKLNYVIKAEDKILEQAEKTNGRVRSLEIWRAYLIGGLVVLTTLVGWIFNSLK